MLVVETMAPRHADEFPSLTRPPVLLLDLPAADRLGDLGDEAAAAAQREDQMQRRAALELVVGCALVVDPVFQDPMSASGRFV